MSRLTPPSRIAMAALFVLLVTAAVEVGMGRSLLGPDGRFALWEGDIWSAGQSQRVADPYSFSHIVHGILFFGLLFLAARRVPLRYRFLAAVVLEAAWEVLENSPLIINRYREATIAVGYEGDSVLNSCADVSMMALGFLLASRLRVWMSIVAVLIMEVGCLVAVRDNLTLNILMLVRPVAAVKAWQLEAAPAHLRGATPPATRELQR